jgi:DNA-directed RNA polymerase sigma subunit (sigma70/sigma32)
MAYTEIDKQHYFNVYELIQRYGGRMPFYNHLRSLSVSERKEFQTASQNIRGFKSRDYLVKAHQGLIIFTLLKKKASIDLTKELIQSGNISLLRAIETYNPYKNIPFASFCSKILAFCVYDQVLENMHIKLPHRIKKLAELLYNESLSTPDQKYYDLGYTINELACAKNHRYPITFLTPQITESL